MRVVLFICAQSYLCALNVVYSEVPNKRSGLLIIFGKFDPPTNAYYFLKFSKFYVKKSTFISQFHIGVLLQILCVFSEHLPTLGECSYI